MIEITHCSIVRWKREMLQPNDDPEEIFIALEPADGTCFIKSFSWLMSQPDALIWPSQHVKTNLLELVPGYS